MSWTGPIYIVIAGGSSDLSASGPGVLVQATASGPITEIAAPAAHNLFGWDNTDEAYANITIGDGLSYDHDTHTLSATGGGGVPTEITVADTEDATCYVALFEAATGDLEPKTDESLLYDASTGELSATSFVGNLTGNVAGDLTGNASTVSVVDSGDDMTTWVLLGVAQTGSLSPATDGSLTYNASTGTLTATAFSGSLTGNASTVTVADAGGDTTTWPMLATSQTGQLSPATDGGLTYNATTNTLTTDVLAADKLRLQDQSGGGLYFLDFLATETLTANRTLSVVVNDANRVLTIAGDATISGTNTGDQTSVTGNAGSVTVADAGGDTTTWVLLGTSQTGSLTPATDAGLTYDATTNTLTAGVFAGNLTGNVTGNSATVTVADAGGDTTTWVLLGTSQTGSLAPATDAGLTYNATTNALTATSFVGALTGNADTATALATARTINGVSFDGTANITITAAGSTLSDTVPISKGGTGQTTAAAARVALLPSMSGNALKSLRVNAGETDYELSSAGSGTVTSITAGTGLSGGTITTTGTISLATTIPQAENIAVTDGVTNGLTTVLNLLHYSTGTPAAGFGLRQYYSLETNDELAAHAAAELDVVWVDPDPISFKGRYILHALDAAGAREFIRGEASGTAPMIGFLGASASAQLVSPDLATMAVTFGLASGSPTLAESSITFTDITTGNASTSNHGFLRKLDNDSTHFMNGQGAWAVPSGTVPTTITVADTTDSTCWVGLFESATGDLAPKTDGGLTYNASTGKLTTTSVTATVNDANTTSAVNLLTLEHTTSGTAAAGFGVEQTFKLEDDGGTSQFAGSVEISWATATSASRKARVKHYAWDNGGAKEYLRGGTNGSAPMIGVLGATEAIQQTGDVGTALVTFGWMSGTPTFAGANVTGTVSAATTAGSCTGNAATATALATARNINGVAFDGTANITVTAAGSTLSDTVTIAKGGTGQTTYPGMGVLWGLTIANNGSDPTNDIDIAVGCAVDTARADLMTLGSAITKRLDASWAVGTNQGGLDTGSIANDWYHLWLIKRSDTGVVDVLFSASATSPTMPTNYDRKCRIGAILRSSGAILSFSQLGDYFLFTTPILDIDASGQSTSAVTRTLSVPDVGGVIAQINLLVNNSSAVLLYARQTTQGDQAPSVSASPLFSVRVTTGSTPECVPMWICTDSNSQITTRSSGASTFVRIVTFGWIDPRGKF